MKKVTGAQVFFYLAISHGFNPESCSQSMTDSLSCECLPMSLFKGVVYIISTLVSDYTQFPAMCSIVCDPCPLPARAPRHCIKCVL